MCFEQGWMLEVCGKWYRGWSEALAVLMEEMITHFEEQIILQRKQKQFFSPTQRELNLNYQTIKLYHN